MRTTLGSTLVVCMFVAQAACQSSSDNSSPPDAGADLAPVDQGAPDPDIGPGPDACSGSLAAEVPDGGMELPPPTGPYGVGTEVRVLVDDAREEPGTPEDTTDKRRIAVALYYPAEPCVEGPPAPLMTRAEGAAVIGPLGLGGLFDVPEGAWEELVVTHARADAPLAAGGGRFPVVIFSHGLGATRNGYTSYLEELASWGFVVVAISHTFDSMYVEFPDGSETGNNMYWISDSQGIPSDAEADAHLAVWLADARFVADELAAWDADNRSGRLTGRLDLDRLGIFGHSYGGATAAEACFVDERFKAGANLDGKLFSPAREAGGRKLARPFMVQLASDHAPDTTIEDFCAKLPVGYAVEIAQTVHNSFSDLPMLAEHFLGSMPADHLFGLGDHPRLLSVSRAYLLAFFREHLAGEQQGLLDGPSAEYPEATLTSTPAEIKPRYAEKVTFVGGFFEWMQPTPMGVADVEVCVKDVPALPCAKTDASGFFALADVPNDRDVVITAKKSGYMTWELPRGPYQWKDLYHLMAPSSAKAKLEAGFGEPLDPAAGQLVVVAVASGNIGGDAGVTITIDPPVGVGPVYGGADGWPDASIESTGTMNGLAWFGNLPPGDYEVTTSKPGKTCEVVLGWQTDAGKLRISIGAGSLQSVFVQCM